VNEAIVVGGGIIGLLCARELVKGGLTVTLLDRDQTGHQASWASAGIVTPRVPRGWAPSTLLNNLSVSLWPGLAEELRAEVGMDVEYRENGCLVPAFDAEEARQLRSEVAPLRQAGVAAEFVDGAALREAEPALGPAVVAAQLMPGGNVDNRRAVRALDLALRKAGATVVTGAQVTEVLERGGRVRGVRTLDQDYEADVVVLAAGSWTGRIAGARPAVPVVPQRGQILALWAPEMPLRRVVLKPDDPYLVPRVDGRIIVGATREFVGYERTVTAGGIAWLLTSAIEMVPSFAGATIHETWTGFRPVSADGMPIIGPAAIGGLFYATGHGASGVGPAPGTAALLAALVLGKEPPIPADAFRTDRFSARQLASFASH
jgi:glycine oxidase